MRAALAWLDANFSRQVEEWIRVTEIAAPSRQEQRRAADVKAQLEAEGLSVTIDSIGNVTARQPGTGGGAAVVLAAQLDTVHPIETDVTVRRDSTRQDGRTSRVPRAPGVFDNSASVANMPARRQPDRRPVFAGSVNTTILNRIQNVFQALQVSLPG